MQTHPSPHPSPLRYVFSVAAGVLPVSLNISHAGAAGTKRSAPVLGPVLGRSNARQRRESGKSQAPGPADVAAAETAALRIIRGAQRTLNRYRTGIRRSGMCSAIQLSLPSHFSPFRGLPNRTVKPARLVGRAAVNPLDYVGLIVIGEQWPPTGKVGRNLYDRVLQG